MATETRADNGLRIGDRVSVDSVRPNRRRGRAGTPAIGTIMAFDTVPARPGVLVQWDTPILDMDTAYATYDECTTLE